MRLKELWLGLLTPVAAFTPASTDQTDRLAAIASYNVLQLQSSPGQYHKYEPRYYGRPFPPIKPPSYGQRKCTPQTVQVRREWDSFSCDEKEAYISAVKCLMSKPSQSNYFAPGSRNRWDDFSAVHINQTGSIHGTVSPPITANLPSIHISNLYISRAASSTGTATSPGSTSAPYAPNVTTPATNPTSTGLATLSTCTTPPSSTAVPPPSAATAPTTPPTTAPTSPATPPPTSSSHPKEAAAASPPAPSPTRPSASAP